MNCHKPGCGAPAMKDDEYCYFHSVKPDVVKRRQEARRRGGSRGVLKLTDDIATVADVKKVLVETINELRSAGTENKIAKGRAIGYLCSIMLTALQTSDLEERISRLEQAIMAEAAVT